MDGVARCAVLSIRDAADRQVRYQRVWWRPACDERTSRNTIDACNRLGTVGHRVAISRRPGIRLQVTSVPEQVAGGFTALGSNIGYVIPERDHRHVLTFVEVLREPIALDEVFELGDVVTDKPVAERGHPPLRRLGLCRTGGWSLALSYHVLKTAVAAGLTLPAGRCLD